MQHVSIPADELDEGQFEDGHAFDGSSVRGFQEIQESDMILVPDPNTAYLDPFRHAQDARHPLLRGRPGHRRALLAATRATSPRRPRSTSSPPASPTPPTSGPSRSSSSSTTCASRRRRTASFYQVDSVEGAWNTGTRRGPEPRLQAADQGGLLPGPADGPLPGPALGDDARRCTQVGIEIELHHHEVASRRPGRDRHPLRHAAGAWPTS